MRSSRKLVATATFVVTAVLATPTLGQARELEPRPWQPVADGPNAYSPEAASKAKAQSKAPTPARSSFSAQEDPPSENTGLPATRENFDVVSSLNPQKFGGVRVGEIADLTVHDGFAYLNSWDNEFCDRGGVYVVDVKNPASPKEVGYIEPLAPFYHGEGAHAIDVTVPGFDGDILAVNNETFGSNVSNTCGPASKLDGGFDLYDVSDPTNPKTLIQGAGDRDNGTPDDPSDDTPAGNSYHSVFIWDTGDNAYLVASDNVEFEDVDIWDITDPSRPTQVADVDLSSAFPQILDNEKSNGNAVFNHDMVVKQIGGRWIMSVSNWDSGYVQIDVTDPANPVYLTDTTTGSDPFRPSLFAEGNSHQSEYSADNQFLLAADEDFAPFRSVLTAEGINKSRSAIEGGDNPNRIANLPDETLNGPSTWAGDGCDPAAVPAAPADDGDPNTDSIALVERGGAGAGCGFADKFDNAAAAGYDGIVIFNQPRPDDGQVNMATTDADGPAAIPGVQMRRADALGAEGALSPSETTPAPGTAGPAVSIGVVFDGWGFTHIYDAKTSARIGSYAVKEAQDPRFASGFGDLSVHEFATDPTEPIAYSAYYGAGMRAVSFSRDQGITEQAKYISDDANGSNFWGVEVFTGSDGERYIAGSDRDFGLQIFRYTGPGAAKRPVCANTSATTNAGAAVSIPLTCTDENTGNTLTRRIASAPANGTVTLSQNTATYTPRAGFSGDDAFGFVANDGAADSAPGRAAVRVAAPGSGPGSNPGTGSGTGAGTGSGPDRAGAFSTTFVPRQRISTVRRRGLLVGVYCGAACSFKMDVVVSTATRRKLGLSARTLGTRRASLTQTGFRRYRVQLSAAARRRLARTGSLDGVLRVTRSAPTPTRRLSRSFQLRRTAR